VVAWQRHGGMPPVPPDEDELLLAKRLVAQKCLYGVDKNPMAADLAKLSLWLATLAKDHPFTFLDHSLRAGDSLVGLGRKQIASLHWDAKAQRTTVTKALEDAIRRAAAARRDILEGGDFLSPELKAQKLALADDALSKPRLIGDCVIAAFFAGSKPKERQAILDRLTEPVEDFLTSKGDYVAARSRLADLANWLRGKPRDKTLAASGKTLAPSVAISHPLTPFHWEIEFPEVFGRENPGFDAIVGNPPFAGKNTLAAGSPSAYPAWLKAVHAESHGNADLVAHFFRLSHRTLRANAAFGLIATNTIAQGDTRTTGLRFICRQGSSIYAATRRLRWPGEAAVVVSVVHVLRGTHAAPCLLDGSEVPLITAFLLSRGGHDNPKSLHANRNRAFVGTYVLGLGFVFDADQNHPSPNTPGAPSSDKEMSALLALNPDYAKVIKGYIGGEELNSSASHHYHRHVIDFGSQPEADVRKLYPDLMRIVEQRVRPERLCQSSIVNPERWWMFARPASELYAEAAGKFSVLAISCAATRHVAFASLPSHLIYSHKLVVVPTDLRAVFACLQSRPHDGWAWAFSSTLKDDLQYTPSDCFETFPFPENFETDARLEAVGKEYYEFRAALMVKNDEGLTKTYNRFHDPGEASVEIARLRELHAAMDRAVLDAYGWQDVQPVCGFALDWLDLDDDELADTLASAPDDIRERIESADYFFPDAASACRFQSHIKKDGKGKLPWRYRWPDEVRDDILARLLALNAQRAELERLTGLPGATSKAEGVTDTDGSDSDTASSPKAASPAKKAKKASKRAAKKSAPRPMFDDEA
jgi:hypothetical protein